MHADSSRDGTLDSSEDSGWRAVRLQPFRILPLWEGGTFDEHYNSGRKAIGFRAPAGTRRVLLESVITGALCCHPDAIIALLPFSSRLLCGQLGGWERSLRSRTCWGGSAAVEVMH